ncbi:MAG TPA: PAS domain S-box protein, partial [Gemmata sp.]
VWAAIRFGPRGATLAVIVIAVFAVWGTVHGTGPFVHTDVYQALLLLDVFLAVVVVTSLILCAVLRERERIEVALRASEARFRQLAEAIPQIVWTSEPDGATTYLNRRWIEYTGLATATADELAQVIHPDDLPVLAAAGADARRSGGALQSEFRLRPAKGGAYRWFLARSVPLAGPGGAPAGHLGTSTDIDDLKQAQAELARHRAELQLILDSVPALIYYKDWNHRLVRVNNALVRLLGLPHEAIVGRTDSELGSPHADDYRRHEEEIMRQGAPQTVVEPLHTFAGTRWLQTTKLPYRDAGGRVIGLLGLSVDITERKLAEEEVRRLNADLEQRVAERTAVAEARAIELQRAVGALRGQKQLLQTILDSLGEAVLVAGKDGQILLQNRAFRQLHAVPGEHATRSDLPRLHGVHLPDGRALCPVDQLPIVRAARGESFDNVELLVLDANHPDGVSVSVTGRPIHGPHGVEGGVIAIRDVSAARRSEAALRASEERFRAIFDQTFQFIGLMSTDGTVLEANRTALAASGITEADVIGKPFWETRWWTHDPEQQDRLRAAVTRAAAGETVRFEATHPAPDGRLIRVDFSLKPFRDAAGNVTLLIPEGRDITDAKRAAEELAATEVLLRQFIKHAPAAIAMMDTEMRYVQASDRWVTDYRLTGRDLIGRSHYEVFPDQPERWKEIHRRVLAGAVEACAEDPFPRADGGTEWLQWECRPWRAAGGEIGGLIMFTQVVTERIRSAEALRESEERFRSAFDHAAVGMALVSPEGRWLKVNQALCQMLGYTAVELLASDFQTVTHPDDLGADFAFANRVLRGELATYQMEKRYLHKDGRVLFGLLAVSLLRDARGAPLYFVSQIKDVTERWQAERALRENEERYRETVEAAPDAIVTTDSRGTILGWNRGAERVFGHTAAEAVGGGVELLVPQGDVGACRAAMAAFDPDRPRLRGRVMEVSARRKGGTEVPVEIALAHWGAGAERRFTAIIRDVTERKRAEQALRASEERYRAVVQALAEGVVVQDRSGVVVACNDRAPSILGLTAEQLTGRTPLDPRWQSVREDGTPYPGEEHPAMVVLRTGQAQFNTVMGVHTPAGQLRWISINAVPLPDPGPAGARVVCSFHDVTAIREASERLRASVREKEVMLKEIHHRVKNNLQIISTLLDLQSDGLTDPAARAAFRESRGRVRSMSLIHERLYRSENLAGVEFGAYLRGLADDLFRAYRADDEAIRLEVSVSAPPLPLDMAIPCGLLVNELISNCLKYAFAGREGGTIAVHLDRAEGGRLALAVADDGVGLPPGFDLRHPTSFGLQLANTLAAQLGGELAVGSGPGARFVVRFPARG